MDREEIEKLIGQLDYFTETWSMDGSEARNGGLIGTLKNSSAALRFLLSSSWEGIESAPRDGTPVLLFGKLTGEINDFNDPPTMVVGSSTGCTWYVDNTDYYAVSCEATHWRPLPSAPVTEESSNG